MGSDNQKTSGHWAACLISPDGEFYFGILGLDTLGDVAHGTGVIHEQIGAELHGLGFQMGYR